MQRTLHEKMCTINKLVLNKLFFFSFLALMVANSYNRISCAEILERKLVELQFLTD